MELRRCYGCMREITEEVCPHCGYSAEKDNEYHQLSVGTMLHGQYLVGRVLGQGGFGITYLGWDTELEQIVAIKEFYPSTLVYRNNSLGTSVCLNAHTAEPGYQAGQSRFLREAQALSKLNHVPEIVGIHACFQENNTAYIVMEFIRGAELAHYVKMKGGRLEAAEALRILKPILTALETVHRAGLVHRDISPDNIMLDPLGGAKLLDFGAVRNVDNPNAELDMTRSTEAIVKHGFAPPEQYRGRGSLGPWTDEYALCATVYYCLTGRVPPDAMARSMDGETVDWANVPGLTRQQRAALEKGMSIKAKDRFGDLGKLRAALFGEEKKAPAPKPSEAPEKKAENTKKKKSPLLLAALLLAAAAVAGGALLLTGKPEPPAQLPRLEETDIPSQSTSVPTEPASIPTEPTTAPTEAPEPWEGNLLIPDPLAAFPEGKESITAVTFLADASGAPEHALDLSQSQDGSVLGWIENGHVTIVAQDGINGRDACESLFADCFSLTEVTFGGAFHTEQTESMAHMFRCCRKLVTVDLENLQTGNVTTMQSMFDMGHNAQGEYAWGWCAVKELNVSGWDVSNVVNMKDMFHYCQSLESVDVSRWDVSSVTNMSGIFSSCGSLATLDVGNWDVSSVTDMSGMFRSCCSLKELDVSSWDVSSVTDMSAMFGRCDNLETLNISGWDVSSVTDMNGMFRESPKLTALDVSGWDVSNVTDMDYMFASCNAYLKITGVNNWDLSSVVFYDYFAPWGFFIDGQDWHYWFDA